MIFVLPLATRCSILLSRRPPGRIETALFFVAAANGAYRESR